MLIKLILATLCFVPNLALSLETNQVTITTDAQYRYIKSNGIPNSHGQFPNRNNPNTISPQDYNFRVPLYPQLLTSITPLQMSVDFGVGIDGVPFDPGTAELWNNNRNWRYEALSGQIDLGLDQNNAHVQRNGEYHYHGFPTELMHTTGGHSALIGYAADGFPIYADHGYINPADASSGVKSLKSSYQLRAGARPSDAPPGNYDGTFTQDYIYVAGSGDLDECNGRSGITPEYPNGTYYYFITQNFPIVPRCFKGTPDPSFTKKGSGPPPGGRQRGMGRGPQNGQRPP